MSTYVDANLLVRMYLELPGSKGVLNLLSDGAGRSAWPYPVTDLLRCDVVNAIHRMDFESRTGGQWRVTQESAAVALADFENDLSDALFLKRTPLTLQAIEPEFDSLVARHTAREGFRTYDVIHVASALTMGCELFLTFDKTAKLLAKRVGLKTNL